MHGLIFETSVWLLAESTRLLSSCVRKVAPCKHPHLQLYEDGEQFTMKTYSHSHGFHLTDHSWSFISHNLQGCKIHFRWSLQQLPRQVNLSIPKIDLCFSRVIPTPTRTNSDHWQYKSRRLSNYINTKYLSILAAHDSHLQCQKAKRPLCAQTVA